MIDLRKMKHPVSLRAEDAAKLVDLLHDVKADLAAHPELDGAYQNVKNALKVADGFIPSKEDEDAIPRSAGS